MVIEYARPRPDLRAPAPLLSADAATPAQPILPPSRSCLLWPEAPIVIRPLIVVAALGLAGPVLAQSPSPQTPALAAAPMPTPAIVQAPARAGLPTVYLVQAAPPVVQAPAPQILISQPPLWDRLLARTGHYLLDRSDRHQHHKAAKLATLAAPTPTAQLVPVQLQLAPVQAPAPVASPQANEAVPLPPFAPINDRSILIPDPNRIDAIRRLYGR